MRDITAPPVFWDIRLWRRKPAFSLHELARALDLAVVDPRVRGILVTIREFGDGMATARSLRTMLARVRDTGRDVVVHLPMGGDTKDIYVATGARRIFVGPRAAVAPMGFASRVRYVRDALDKAGVVPEVYARGRYKSAGEQVMRSSMSDPQREQVGALLDALYDDLADGIADGRKLSREASDGIIDAAPYHVDEAVKVGLIDGGAYEDELATRLGTSAKEEDRVRIIPAGAYARARTATQFRRVGPPRTIAVIEVRGAIAHRGGGMPFSAIATDDAVIGAVRLARRNRRIRGVVLLIDSPGGSALASDRMHHELEQLAAEKPLVAYMANVAASGGYYVAAPAHEIVAQPTTITGSIGVVAARAAIDPVLERLGVVTEVVRRGARAEFFGATRAFTDDEQAVMRHQLAGTYRGFLEVVAAGRKKSVDEVATVAEGRVWSGKDAHRVGLVDTLGGFDVALARVRARVGRGAHAMEPVIVRPPRHSEPLDPPKAKQMEAMAMVASLARLAGIEAGELAPLALALTGERVLAWCDVRVGGRQ